MSKQKDKCPDCKEGYRWKDTVVGGVLKATQFLGRCPTCNGTGEKKLDRPDREKIAWLVYPKYDTWENALKFADQIIARSGDEDIS